MRDELISALRLIIARHLDIPWPEVRWEDVESWIKEAKEMNVRAYEEGWNDCRRDV